MHALAGAVDTTVVAGLAQPTAGTCAWCATDFSHAFPGMVDWGVSHLQTDETDKPGWAVGLRGVEGGAASSTATRCIVMSSYYCCFFFSSFPLQLSQSSYSVYAIYLPHRPAAHCWPLTFNR